MSNEKSDTRDRELLVTRLLNAPVDLVWEVFTKAEHIAQWWGPNGFTNTISEMTVEPGGKWNLIMHGPDGTDYKNNIVYREVVRNKKLVFDHVSTPKHYTTISFEEQGDKTLLTWHMIFETKEQFLQVIKAFKADGGLIENIEKMVAYIDARNNSSK